MTSASSVPLTASSVIIESNNEKSSSAEKQPDIEPHMTPLERLVASVFKKCGVSKRIPSAYLRGVKTEEVACVGSNPVNVKFPHEYFTDGDDDCASIIDSPAKGMVEHDMYLDGSNTIIREVLNCAHCDPKETRLKGIVAGVSGRGSGKTTTLELLRAHLNLVPGVMALSVTFNNNTGSDQDFKEESRKYRNQVCPFPLPRGRTAKETYAVGVIARLYNLSFDSVADALEEMPRMQLFGEEDTRLGPSEPVAELLKVLVADMNRWSSENKCRIIDTVVVLLDEPTNAEDELSEEHPTDLEKAPALRRDFGDVSHAVLAVIQERNLLCRSRDVESNSCARQPETV